jgi:hypothetical protein
MIPRDVAPNGTFASRTMMAAGFGLAGVTGGGAQPRKEAACFLDKISGKLIVRYVFDHYGNRYFRPLRRPDGAGPCHDGN